MFGKNTKGPMCPLIKSECVESACKFWTHVRGTHPQSGADMDMHDCAVKWLPVLLIENAKESRQTGAAVESFRNEQAKSAESLKFLVANNTLRLNDAR